MEKKIGEKGREKIQMTYICNIYDVIPFDISI